MLVYLTHPDMREAHKLAQDLVAARLAAGVNIIPHVLSVYRWEDKIVNNYECALFCQIDDRIYPEFEKAVRNAHPHKVPCIIGLHVETGNDNFLCWIQNSCGDD